jgi:formylglycine-generating enzyme required for sulfatase activity
VRTEAHFGHDRRKLVPVKIEPCEPPLAFSLTQTIDLCGWQGAQDNRQWRKLLTWLADLRAPRSDRRTKPDPEDNPFRAIVGHLASGEPIVDGAFINEATAPGTVFREAPDMPLMRVVGQGHFLMGGIAGDPDRSSFEAPQKKVRIDYPLAVGLFPVTSREFDHLCSRPAPKAPEPRRFGWFGGKAPDRKPEPVRSGPDCPVNCVSWADANAYAQALSQASASAYRLPSESEWEYACRAGSGGRYCWGDDIDPTRACFGRPPGSGPSPTGTFAPNAFGLYDLHGNVREWTQDLWHESYDMLPLDGRPLLDGHSSMRVTRGGGWSDPPSMVRSSARGRATETLRSEVIGFRVVRDLPLGNVG